MKTRPWRVMLFWIMSLMAGLPALAADWSGTRVRVLDQQSTWPAAALSGLGTPWNTVQAQGHDFVLVLNKRVEHIVDLLSLVLCERGGLQPYGIELRFDNFLAATLPGRLK